MSKLNHYRMDGHRHFGVPGGQTPIAQAFTNLFTRHGAALREAGSCRGVALREANVLPAVIARDYERPTPAGNFVRSGTAHSVEKQSAPKSHLFLTSL